MRIHLLVLFSSIIPVCGWATHIAGAELSYKNLDSGTFLYEVNVTLYRDCRLGDAEFDEEIYLFVFSTRTNELVEIIPISLSSVLPLPTQDWFLCSFRVLALCIEKGQYIAEISLPPIEGGYTLGWARCCRNEAVTNIVDPKNLGVTVLAHVPNPLEVGINSSPRFGELPPLFLCLGEEFIFDHSATDPDGDKLVYRLSEPLHSVNVDGLGALPDVDNPVVDPDRPMGGPPYQKIPFEMDYSYQDPFGGGSFFLDPETGIMTLSPPNLGYFVFAITVEEYRDGVKIGESQRDFQLAVIDCNPQSNTLEISHTFRPGDETIGDTLLAIAGEEISYSVRLTDQVSNSLILFPVSPSLKPDDPSNIVTIALSGINPSEATVNWVVPENLGCGIIPLIFGGRDSGACPGYGVVFDTAYVFVRTSLAIELSEDQLCPGESVSFSLDDSLIDEWMWDFGDGTSSNTPAPTHTYQEAGTYVVSFLSGLQDACVAVPPTQVEVATFPDPLIQIQNISCNGSEDGSIRLTPKSGSDLQYQWGHGPQTPLVASLGAGEYTVLVTNSFGCSTELESLAIMEPSTLFIRIGEIVESFCSDPNGSASVIVRGGTAPYSYEWNDPLQQRDSLGQNLVGGLYQVLITDANGCSQIQNINVPDNPPPTVAFSLQPNPNFPLLVDSLISATNLSENYTSLLWDFGDGSEYSTENPTHRYNKGGTYCIRLTAENQWMCTATDSVCIRIRSGGEIFFPSAFSPNGDGINDTFTISGYAVRSVRMVIFNRWGLKVKEITDLQDGWDGTSDKGNVLPEGVYTFKVQAELGDENTLERAGTITLIK